VKIKGQTRQNPEFEGGGIKKRRGAWTSTTRGKSIGKMVLPRVISAFHKRGEGVWGAKEPFSGPKPPKTRSKQMWVLMGKKDIQSGRKEEKKSSGCKTKLKSKERRGREGGPSADKRKRSRKLRRNNFL